MSKIILAKHIGFCSGVKRAVKLAYEAAKKGRVYSLGPLIHNPQEVERLGKAGIKIVKNLSGLKKGYLIVRSHGLPQKTIGVAKKQGLKIIDATCPLVKKVQKIACQLKEERYWIIMVGDRHHPEVRAIWESAGRKFSVVSNGKEAEVVSSPRSKIGIIAQTTQSEANFVDVIDRLKRNNKDLKIYNTICRETARRQKELLGLVKRTDAILVIGGFNSANTRRLVELSRQSKIQTHHLESSKNLNRINLNGVKNIGIITGASTPDWLVKEIMGKLKKKLNEKSVKH